MTVRWRCFSWKFIVPVKKKKKIVGIEARECCYTSVHCSPACVTCLSVHNVKCVSVCAPIFGSYKLIRVWDLRLTERTTAPPLWLWRKKTRKPPQLQRSWKAWISFRVMLTVPLWAVSFFFFRLCRLLNRVQRSWNSSLFIHICRHSARAYVVFAVLIKKFLSSFLSALRHLHVARVWRFQPPHASSVCSRSASHLPACRDHRYSLVDCMAYVNDCACVEV